MKDSWILTKLPLLHIAHNFNTGISVKDLNISSTSTNRYVILNHNMVILFLFPSYPCHWGGCVDAKPVVAGLEEFGARVLNTLLNAVKKMCPDDVSCYLLLWI